VRRPDAGALVVLTGIFALWIGLTDAALLYVRPTARVWLVLAGATLVLIGLALLVLEWRRGTDDENHDARRHRIGRVGWLLAVPIAVAIAVGSNPLGSYAAGRQNSQRTLPPGTFDLEAYLNANSFGGQAPPLRVLDFTRAAYDPETQDLLAGTSITLQGFVTEDTDVTDAHHFLLTRFMIGCCAADAIAMFVQVDLDDHHLPPVDAWVSVEGVLVPEALDPDQIVPDPPVLDAIDVSEIDRPDEVYEYPP
jgi:uncharacterized repeat protein (TIGR03943 family)